MLWTQAHGLWTAVDITDTSGRHEDERPTTGGTGGRPFARGVAVGVRSAQAGTTSMVIGNDTS